MISFKVFLKETASHVNFGIRPMVNTGHIAAGHVEKYIKPFIGQKATHTLKSDHENFEAGTKLNVHGHKVIGGVHHAIVSKGSSEKRTPVPFSKILKPITPKNTGIDFESKIVKHLSKHGLMEGHGAGCTNGNDFHLINKNKGVIHKGKMAEEISHQGEAKKNLTAAFGQASLTHAHDIGWHFAEKTKAKYPKYTASIENATVVVGGKSKSLLKHVNQTYGPPHKTIKSSINLYSTPTDLHPMNAYLHDHNVEVLHVGSHGTFRAGRGDRKDTTEIGLPKTVGEGQFRVRQKHQNSLTVQFNVKKLNQSTINLEDKKDIQHIKEKLGH